MSPLRMAVTDRDGWRQEMALDKAILHAGSDPRNDVVLATARGGGVAPRHLQLITITPNKSACRLVNVGDADILIGPRGEKRLAPRDFADVSTTEQLRIGDFTLNLLGFGPAGEATAPGRPVNGLASRGQATTAGVAAPIAITAAELAAVEGPTPAGPTSTPTSTEVAAGPGAAVLRTSRFFSLGLNFPQTTLSLEAVLSGSITLQHLGDKTGVQFRLEVEGLDPECYEIGPGPILYPNGQREVFFRVRHPRKPGLAAGRVRFRIQATAAGSYPGEAAVVAHTLYVQAFHHHHLRLTMTD